MKKIFYFLFAVMLCGAFMGCSNDDDSNNANYEEQIVGTWELYKSYDDGEWDYDYGEDSEWGLTLSFRADGTGSYVEKDGGIEMCPIKWELIATYYLKVLLICDDGFVEEMSGKIKIDKNELEWDWGDGWIDYYRRVK